MGSRRAMIDASINPVRVSASARIEMERADAGRRVTVTLPAELAKCLQQSCRFEDVSASAIMERALGAYVRRGSARSIGEALRATGASLRRHRM